MKAMDYILDDLYSTKVRQEGTDKIVCHSSKKMDSRFKAIFRCCSLKYKTGYFSLWKDVQIMHILSLYTIVGIGYNFDFWLFFQNLAYFSLL